MIRVFASVLGVLAFAVGAAGLVSRYLPIDNEFILVVAAASPYLAIAGVIAMILFALARRWVLTILAAVLCVVMVGVQLPRFIGPENAGVPSVAVRVLSANLGLGEADPVAVVQSARNSADVVVLQEMTAGLAAAMSGAGLDATFPHRVIDPRPQAAGIGVWSRYPIVSSAPIEGYQMPMLSARIRVPDVRFDPTVLAVHLAAPLVQPLDDFTNDYERFPGTLREVAKQAGSGAVIVAGDLNATYDMRPFRRLLDEGYRDAAEQVGAGMTRSFPSTVPGQPWRRPVVGIDHVLVRSCVATSAGTVSVPGSDHRGLLTTIEIPVDPTASYPDV
ncbi:endonuclease/exonuclease/phosphatase family protein [Mycobacterium neglectum]|uniref:endonuclease/exonuclease/phosphatase family protein n=1 Tax=Mycobacterium neglectum TaxID=242737 RepID=UPI000BFEB689|nr:endonuclease/exonuclease/phosphatase family protein [Mycobacterium neglectum]